MAERLEYNLQGDNYGSSSSGRISLSINSGFAANYQWRFYKVGDPAPAWSNMVVIVGIPYGASYGIFGPVLSGGAGTYIVEYKDDDRPAGVQIAIIKIGAYGDSCYDEAWVSATGSVIKCSSEGFRITTYIYQDGSEPADYQAKINRKVSIDGGTTWFSMDQTQQPLGNQILTKLFTWQELYDLGYNDQIPNVKLRREDNACVDTIIEEIFTLVESSIFLTESHTNVTAFDADDGTITITVNDGSGDYTVVWDDDPTTALARTGLAAGVYTITVTDNLTGADDSLTITLLEPAFIAPIDPVFSFPVLNPVHFVVDPVIHDGDEILQTLDNVLLRNQYHPGFDCTNYFQPVTKGYITPFQINSNYTSHIAQLLDYSTDEIVKQFAVVLKEQLAGTKADYAVTLRAHIGFPNQTRVYFNVGIPPIPLVVGEAIEILNSSNSIDNIYNIAEINLDSTLGYQYLVINIAYVGPLTSSATGRFDDSLEEFNVYEVAMDFQDVADGKYYVKVTAFNEDINTNRTAISEPIDLKVAHLKTLVITYRNNDNGYGDVSWTTGMLGIIRIPGIIYKRMPGGERSTSRDADYSLVKINAKKTRGMMLEVYMMPPYMHELLSLVFDCDFFTVNGVEMQASDGYEEPEYIDRFLLSNSKIKLEQKHWFRNYNSDDIGTVNEEGFITTETGFLKR